MVKGYCLKEKKAVDIVNPKYELNKLGRPIARGECSSCGGKVYKILKATEVPPELKAKIPAKKGGRSKRSKASKKSKKSKKSRSRKSKHSHKK